MGWPEYLWIGSIAALAIVVAIYPWLPKQTNPNHRVRLIGSRFSAVDEPSRTMLNT
jgi:hypothetical protein